MADVSFSSVLDNLMFWATGVVDVPTDAPLSQKSPFTVPTTNNKQLQAAHPTGILKDRSGKDVFELIPLTVRVQKRSHLI